MKITDMQMSALVEAGNIGSGHAAIALSQLIGRKIMIDVPSIDFTKLDFIGSIIGGPDKQYFHVSIPVLGDMRGIMVFVIEYSMAIRLCKIMLNGKTDVKNVIGDIERSALKETGSILSISYLNAISEMSGLSLIASVPQFAVGGTDDIPRFVELHDESFERSADVISIKTEFIESGSKIDAYQFFISGMADIGKLISALGV